LASGSAEKDGKSTGKRQSGQPKFVVSNHLHRSLTGPQVVP
jgi:hypothetical protein